MAASETNNELMPNFFIVGAPKCGTTSMYDYLRQHPDIFMPEDLKEPHYFGSDLKFRYLRLTREEYVRLFASAEGKKIIGEASTFYLQSRNAAKEIQSAVPNAKIIIMLRNPVDVMHALHGQALYNGDEDVVDFEKALEAEDERKRGNRIPATNQFVSGLFYRETVNYSEQIEQYFTVFGKDNVHCIIFDDFIQKTGEIYRETVKFLGGNDLFCPHFTIANPSKVVRSRALLRFMQDPAVKMRPLVKMIISESCRKELRNIFNRLNTKHVKRSPMSTELRKKLLLELMPEISRVSKLLGKDLSFWYMRDK